MQNNVCSHRKVPPQAKNTITLGQYDPQKLTPKTQTVNISIHNVTYILHKRFGENRLQTWMTKTRPSVMAVLICGLFAMTGTLFRVYHTLNGGLLKNTIFSDMKEWLTNTFGI